MKLSIFLLLLVQVYLPQSCGQQAGRHIAKGYAYSRETLQGRAPGVKIDENGVTSESASQASQQYFIYVEVPRPLEVEVKNIWIRGKKYEAGITEVMMTPVVLTNPSVTMEKDTLVAKSGFKVWQIIPKMEAGAAAQSSSDKQPGAPDEVVVDFLYKNKMYQYPIRNIKKLHPVALQ